MLSRVMPTISLISCWVIAMVRPCGSELCFSDSRSSALANRPGRFCRMETPPEYRPAAVELSKAGNLPALELANELTQVELARVQVAELIGADGQEDEGVLTPREVDIVRLVEAGMSNKRIANTLAISLETVKWNLKNIFLKLDVTCRYDAMIQARRSGLLG